MSETKKPRHLVAKAQQKGTLYYWQPSAGLKRAGFKTVALGKDREAAIKAAEAINVKVDQWRGGLPVLAKNTHGTLPWLIERFKESTTWAKLVPNSRRTYESYFNVMLRWSAEKGDPPMRTITMSDAEALWSSMQERTPSMAQYVIRQCSQLWKHALKRRMGVVDHNPFWGLELPQLPPRDQIWRPSQIAAVCETALMTPVFAPYGHSVRTGKYYASIAHAVIIGANTCQRECDILAMRRSQYDGRYITVTQQKTGAVVTIPVTAELKVTLENMLRVQPDADAKVVALPGAGDRPLVMNETTGRRWHGVTFQKRFRQIAKSAGIPDALWFEDLRRTGTTALAEAGCTLHEIAAIGGWSVDTVAKMMRVYAKANVVMADNAIQKVEAYRKRQLEG